MHKNQTEEAVHEIDRTAEEKREHDLGLIRGVLKHFVRHRGVDATQLRILDALVGQVVTPITIRLAYDRLRTNLPDCQAWTDAVAYVRQARPEWCLDEGTLKLLTDEWAKPELAEFEVDGERLLKLAEVLDKNYPFPLTESYLSEQDERQERARLIENISLGKSQYTALGNNDNRRTVYQTKDLLDEPTEVLRDIHRIVSEQRRVEGLSVAEIQAERKKREFERVKALNAPPPLPSYWVPSENGVFSNVGPAIIAGQRVELTPETFKRMSRSDIGKILRIYGGDAVNSVLVGYKQPQEFGRIQIIRG